MAVPFTNILVQIQKKYYPFNPPKRFEFLNSLSLKVIDFCLLCFGTVIILSKLAKKKVKKIIESLIIKSKANLNNYKIAIISNITTLITHASSSH